MAKPDRKPKRYPFFLIGTACFVVGVVFGWTPLARQIDTYHYDWLLRLYPPATEARDAMLLEFDEATFRAHGGLLGMRRTLAEALEVAGAAKPKVLAVDLILAEPAEPAVDGRLAQAFRGIPNLVLAADLMSNGEGWEEPIPLFRANAKAVGHVHADPDPDDGVSRRVQFEKAAGRDRKWALALEAYRLSLGGETIVESPRDLEIGKRRIPAPKHGEAGRSMYIRYRRQGVPGISINDLLAKPELAARLKDKVVFAGVTAQSQARDRLMTPYTTQTPMPGVEINAHIYETLAQRDFLSRASNVSVVVVCLAVTFATVIAFAYVGGWHAYAVAFLQILMAHSMPHTLMSANVVFPLLAPAGCAWLTAIFCAGYQYFVVRKQLGKSEADRARYQDALQFVSHEMRSPLTAIQGSSELMSRYNLTDEKRKQIAQMINSESKRLARMIQTFLDVERLSEGQMDLRKEPFLVRDVVNICMDRVHPLAERKRIAIERGEMSEDSILGDRELMEYAVYNLLTNAVKYSPPETHVNVEVRRHSGQVRIAVRDEGIGMDEKEQKKLFTRFYRTERAEKSGENGTGIGLSIVKQIVQHHGGEIEVVSAPQKGSCFTIVVPVRDSKRALKG